MMTTMTDEELTDLGAFLVKPLVLSKKDWLKAYFVTLELARSPLLSLRVKLQRELFVSREKLRLPNYKPDPKDKDTPRYTDFDRRTMLDSQTAELNERYEYALGLENLVKERIELIKVLLEK